MMACGPGFHIYIVPARGDSRTGHFNSTNIRGRLNRGGGTPPFLELFPFGCVVRRRLAPGAFQVLKMGAVGG